MTFVPEARLDDDSLKQIQRNNVTFVDVWVERQSYISMRSGYYPGPCAWPWAPDTLRVHVVGDFGAQIRVIPLQPKVIEPDHSCRSIDSFAEPLAYS